MTKPSAWRAFLRPAAYRTFWNAPRVEKGQPHGSETSPLPDGGPVQALLKVRHGIRLPCRSITDRLSDKGLPPPPASKRHETGTLPGSSCASSRVVRVPAPPTRPSLPVSPKRPLSARIASRPAACHAASLIKAYARRDPPLHRRKALPILSELFQRPEASARKKLRPSSLPGIPSLLSGRMACLIPNSRQTATGTFAST